MVFARHEGKLERTWPNKASLDLASAESETSSRKPTMVARKPKPMAVFGKVKISPDA